MICHINEGQKKPLYLLYRFSPHWEDTEQIVVFVAIRIVYHVPGGKPSRSHHPRGPSQILLIHIVFLGNLLDNLLPLEYLIYVRGYLQSQNCLPGPKVGRQASIVPRRWCLGQTVDICRIVVVVHERLQEIQPLVYIVQIVVRPGVAPRDIIKIVEYELRQRVADQQCSLVRNLDQNFSRSNIFGGIKTAQALTICIDFDGR
mmetsp:Transcript_15316/g.32420  ORF Transcript_15316/g.32420 Transcript_15316/m.32420 type:complete len:202 (-) Transcript_15316:372-977(-)